MTMNTPLTDFEDGVVDIIDDEVAAFRKVTGRADIQPHEQLAYTHFLKESARRIVEYCMENCGSIKAHPEEE